MLLELKRFGIQLVVIKISEKIQQRCFEAILISFSSLKITIDVEQFIFRTCRNKLTLALEY